MTCEDVKKHFADLWRGTLAGQARADFEAHLAKCDSCRQEAAALTPLWMALGSVPEPEPGEGMRLRFYDSLRGWRSQEERRRARFSWLTKPAFAVGLALVMLAVGVGAGHYVTRQDAQISQLKGQLDSMRQLVALSLMQQQSASDRLRGVNYAVRVEQSDTEVLTALLATIDHDANVNVRLAAVDALRNFSDSPDARRGLVQALGKQKSPLMQIAVIDQIVEMREHSAAAPLQNLLNVSNLNPDVKQRAAWALRKLQQ